MVRTLKIGLLTLVAGWTTGERRGNASRLSSRRGIPQA